MNIVTLSFAAFVLVVLALYYLLPRRPQNILLLGASYIFYATWSIEFPFILFAVTLVSFVLAQRLQPTETNATERRRWLWLGIGFNLFVLVLFKYAGFFVDDITARLSSWGLTHTEGLEILLPIGLSFYILQAISYLIDVSRKQLPASTDMIDFALYMAYFPKLTSGPIERARAFLPKLNAQRIVDNDQLARSFTLIVVGVVRKLVIADSLAAMIPAAYYNAPGTLSVVNLLTYALAYAFWLYNDFAGYTSVVRGVSGLFGIELSPNFQQPYFARNFTEFWNRWHITLSQWLRDYIYFPLSRALIRRNPSRWNVWNILLPPLVTMLLSGLWHGTGWHMVVWGGLHGLYLVGERLFGLWRPAVAPQKQPRWRQVFAIGVVFTLVVIAWVPFSLTLPHATEFARRLTLDRTLHRPSVRVLVVIFISLWIDWVQYRRGGNEIVFLRWPRLVQATLLALALLAIFLVTQATISPPFIYQGF
ncbi:MAG TPA: MBOAT family O-acyltransferase [Aggregatilineaceae bacterium]|nr:MBOAT family O-acyltransferase [Aggregatilineaceae bacterium]